MADFKKAFHLTDAAEGGYSNKTTDTGGETYRGISRKNWPNWSGWEIIDEHKRRLFVNGLPAGYERILTSNLATSQQLDQKVEAFYKLNFWDVNNLDGITSQAVANELYDTGVNMGTGIAGVFLQRALNVMNKQGALWPDLAQDGAVGPKTVNAANLAPSSALAKVLNCLQGARYVEICEKNPAQEANFNGWINNRVSL